MVKSKSTKQDVVKTKTKSIKFKPERKDSDSVTLHKLTKTGDSSICPGDLVSTSTPLTNGLIQSWNLKLVSWNVNGLRANIKHNGLKYLLEEDADIVGIQETKCSESDMPIEAKELQSYTYISSSAKKNGYAGTAIYSKMKPISISRGIGKEEHDDEGRVITTEYEKFYFVTAYVPNSGRGLVRLDYRKNSWDVDFIDYLKKLDALKPIIVCGDLNVSHKEIDLANPKSNLRTAGFTKEEREGFDSLLESVGLVDTFRHIYPDRRDAYTFWSYMGNSRSKNVGWRLDYFLISKRLLPKLCNQELRTKVPGSDHCPIVLYLDM